jgi:hypothetical protein
VYCGPPQFTLIGGTDWTVPGWTENEELTDDPFKLAVAVTVPEAVAAETLTANVAVVCPDATVTEAGILNVLPVAAAPSETTVPEAGAAALNVRVHEADEGAVIEFGEQTIDLIAGTTWITLLVEIVTAVAAVDAPKAFVNWMPEGVAVVPAESCRVAVATIPFKILLWLRP